MFNAKTLIALVPLLLAGCVGAPGAEPGSRVPGHDEMDFRGEHGNVSLRLENVAWIHIVVAAAPYLADDDLEVRVRMDFAQAGRGPQALINHIGLLEPKRDVPTQTETCSWPHDSAEDCSDDLTLEREIKAIRVNRFRALAEEQGLSKLSYHFFLAVFNAPPPFNVTVEGRWNNTILNLTHGPPSDTALYFLSDFQRASGLDRTFEVETQANRSLGFDFLVRPIDGNVRYSQVARNPSYVRPDGTVQTVREVSRTEFSPLTGRWLYNVPEENLDVTQDVPVLMKVEFAQAALTLD